MITSTTKRKMRGMMSKYKKLLRISLKLILENDISTLEQVILRYAYNDKLLELKGNVFILTKKGKKFLGGNNE